MSLSFLLRVASVLPLSIILALRARRVGRPYRFRRTK